MKKIRYLAILMSSLGFGLSPTWGDDTTKPAETPTVPTVASDDADENPDTEAPDPTKDAERATKLATQFGLTEQQVLDMRQTSKMGWGEIRNLLLIAQAVSLNSATTTTPLTMDQALTQILTQRSGGMGIGQIAHSYNLKLGDLNKAALSKADKPDVTGKPDKLARVDRPESSFASGKPDKPTRPDRFDKPDKPNKPDHPDKPDKPDHHGKGD